MSTSQSRAIRTLATILAASAIAFAAAAAPAKAPKFKSGTYAGTLAGAKNFIKVTMRLSGKTVSRIRLSDIPFYCSGGGRPIRFDFGGSSISARGKFTVKGTNVIKIGPLKGKVGSKLTLTGRFHKNGTVTGTLKVVYPRTASCNGSSKFSAKT